MPPILSAFMKSRQYLMNDKCNDIGAGLFVADEGDREPTDWTLAQQMWYAGRDMRYNCENRINTPPSPFSLKSEETTFCKRATCPKLIFDIVLRIGVPDIIIPSRIDYGCAEVVSECCIIIGERVVCFQHELKSGLFLSGVRSPIVYLSFVNKWKHCLNWRIVERIKLEERMDWSHWRKVPKLSSTWFLLVLIAKSNVLGIQDYG